MALDHSLKALDAEEPFKFYMDNLLKCYMWLFLAECLPNFAEYSPVMTCPELVVGSVASIFNFYTFTRIFIALLGRELKRLATTGLQQHHKTQYGVWCIFLWKKERGRRSPLHGSGDLILQMRKSGLGSGGLFFTDELCEDGLTVPRFLQLSAK